MDAFRANRVHEGDGKPSGRLETITFEDLGEGDVVIAAAYSDINYKDALAATGSAKIMRRLPMVAGIDVAGTVVSSTDERFSEGETVLIAGAEMSEKFDGGYAEYVRAPADAVVSLPDGLSLYEAMAVGTAGFTAALAVERMELNGQHPGLGPVFVNGATGGVGSFAGGAAGVAGAAGALFKEEPAAWRCSSKARTHSAWPYCSASCSAVCPSTLRSPG